jgi:Dolichyl-phosphate-mannose-protein mannosyltransferase
MPHESAPGSDRASILLPAGALVAAALLLRLCAASRKVLWFDEFLSANFSRRSWGELFAAIRHEAHPPLYFAALKVWTAAFGDGPAGLKSLSIAAGIVALVFLFLAIERLAGALPALVAGVLFAFSSVQIDQATDAKPYALLALFCAVLLWSLAVGGRGSLAVAVAAALACASTHFFGLLGVGTIALAGLLADDRAGRRRRAAAAMAAAAAAGAFWLPAALRLPRGAADYIRRIWEAAPRLAPLVVSSRIALPGWRGPYPVPMPRGLLPGFSLRELAAAAAVSLLLVLGVRSRRRAAAPGFLAMAGIFLFAGTICAESLAALAGRPFGLPGRFEVLPQMGLALLCAAAVGGIPAGRRIVLTLFLLFGAWTSAEKCRLERGPRPIRREQLIVRALEARTLAGRWTRVVTLGLARPPLDYYAAGDPRLRIVSFPQSQDAHPGWREEDEAVVARARLALEADALARQLDGELSQGIEVYLALRPDPRNEILLSRLRQDHDLAPTPYGEWFYRLIPAPLAIARTASSTRSISLSSLPTCGAKRTAPSRADVTMPFSSSAL